MVGLLRGLADEYDQTPGRGQHSALEHSLAVAQAARDSGALDEMVFVALIHDACRVLAPVDHGRVVAEAVRDKVSDGAYWVLRTHGAFQARLIRGLPTTHLFPGRPWRPHAISLAYWETASFDDRPRLPLDAYLPLIRATLDET